MAIDFRETKEIHERQDCFAYLKNARTVRATWKSGLIRYYPACWCLNKLYCKTGTCNFYAHRDEVDLETLEAAVSEYVCKGGDNSSDEYKGEAEATGSRKDN